MIRTAALALAIAAIFCLNSARAAAPQLYVSLYGAERTPDVDPADGSVHAFMCLSPTREPNADAAAGALAQACFAFRPQPGAVRLVKLSDGGALARGQSGAWTETPGGFHFAQKSLTRDRLVLFDASRGMTWSLSLPRGPSSIHTSTASADWYQVTGVDYDASLAGYVAAPDIAEKALQDHPAPPSGVVPVFTRKVDPRLRVDLYSIVNAWNAKGHALTASDCLGLIDAVAATIGARRPPHGRDTTAEAYVKDLIKLNP